jgi:type VI secretion system protein ImpG
VKRAFREAYNRELAILKERSADFAADYPGIADRLGGLLEDNLDPAIGGLLEGSAFLAARVQLNLDEQFRVFTTELLEQVLPGALAPTPSAMIIQAKAAPGIQLEDGLSFEPGEYIDARYVDADKRVACRFRLSAPLTMWPLELSALKYHDRPGPIGALGHDVMRQTKAGIVIDLKRNDGMGDISELPIDTLPIHFIGTFREAAILYSQIFADCVRVSLRWLDQHGDPVFRVLPNDAIEQLGFRDEERLFPYDPRMFRGFSVLHEGFVLPSKFLGMRLNGLKEALKGIKGDTVQLVFELSTPNDRISSRLEVTDLGLHCVPAVNLFEESAGNVRLDDKRHEFVVTPDSSPMTHYEIHSFVDVFAHYAGHQNKVRVHPLYALSPDGEEPRQMLYYTFERRPRRLTAAERRFGGSKYRYRGTETFITIYEPPDVEGAQRLQIKTLASNRHLPEYLPIASGKDDFTLASDQTITAACVSGPTPPRESLVDTDIDGPHRAVAGDNYWRLISFLQLAHYGLVDRDDGTGAAALREMLSIFADLSDSVTEAQISGVRSVETRPITRTIRRAGAYHPARGLEVKITLDEDEFEGSHIMLLSSILDRFLADFAAVNAFTQTVIHSRSRGHIKTFPPRSGSGPLI